MLRDTVLEIDLDQWDRNLDLLQEELMGTKILAVLKANAYGHGAREMARVLESRGICSFAVATLNEALHLRKSSSSRILIFTPTPIRHYKRLLEAGFIQSIGSFEEGLALIKAASETGYPAEAELKIDTGLHRWGFSPDKTSLEEIRLLSSSGLHISGIYSHLSLTSEEEDEKQFSLFMAFVNELREFGIDAPRHLADSIAGIDRPQYRLDQVRLGSALYGMHSFKKGLPVLPIASLKTKIAKIMELSPGEGVGYDYLWRAKKKSKLATLPLGYVDGLPRSLSDKAYVIIKGRRAPFRGLMCMDSISVDVTQIPDVQVGDDVLVFGTGLEGELTIEEMAILLSTNKNQLLASLSQRLPRSYIRKGKNWIIDDLVGE